MDAASFERVYDSLQEFHAFFAASFGRKQWRDHSGNYLQALLVQDQERRNAENLSESVGSRPGRCSAFSPRPGGPMRQHRAVAGILGRLGHPAVVFPSPSRGGNLGVLQYCGRLGKVANQGGMFLAYVKRLYLPKSWTSDQDRCAAAGVPENRRNYRSKTELALEMLERVLELGYSGPSGLPETTPSGCRRPSGRDWRPWGCATCWPGNLALGPGLAVRNIRGSAAPANPSSGPRTSSAVMNCRMRLGGR